MMRVYTKDDKYYLRSPGKIFRIDVKLVNGNIDLTPANESIEICGDNDLIEYSIITIDDLKEKLTKKVEKPVEEPKAETERFPGLFESKKSNKKYK